MGAVKGREIGIKSKCHAQPQEERKMAIGMDHSIQEGKRVATGVAIPFSAMQIFKHVGMVCTLYSQ